MELVPLTTVLSVAVMARPIQTLVWQTYLELLRGQLECVIKKGCPLGQPLLLILRLRILPDS